MSYVSAIFSCLILGLLSQRTKKTLGQKLLSMFPSENSFKRTEDQANPQEVFKMLIDLVSIFAFLLEVVVKLIFLFLIKLIITLHLSFMPSSQLSSSSYNLHLINFCMVFSLLLTMFFLCKFKAPPLRRGGSL